MKREVKAIIAVVLSVWLFVMGFELGSYKEKKNIANSTRVYASTPTPIPSNPATTQTTQAEQTLFSFDEASTEASTQAATDSLQSLLTTMATPETTTGVPTLITSAAAPSTTAAAPTSSRIAPAPATTAPKAAPTTTAKAQPDPSRMSKDDILRELTAAMRTLKSERNMLAVKTEATKLTVTECSASSAVGLLNKALESSGINGTTTYNFKNGQAVGVDAKGKPVDDGKTVTPHDVIHPVKQDFSLPASGVQSATAKRSGSDTVYTVKIVKERTSLQNPVPPYNSKAMGYVDLAARMPSAVTPSEVNITYPGSVVTATVNSAGKIVKLTEYMPLQGDGAAKITVFNGTARFEGDVSAAWTFTY